MEADDLEKVVHATAEETRKTMMSKGFSEAQLEQIRNIVTEAIDKHIEEYEHPEKKVSVEELCNEEREED